MKLNSLASKTGFQFDYDVKSLWTALDLMMIHRSEVAHLRGAEVRRRGQLPARPRRGGRVGREGLHPLREHHLPAANQSASQDHDVAAR